MESIAWMAWTLPTAIFFVALACTLAVMTWLAAVYPEAERVGVLQHSDHARRPPVHLADARRPSSTCCGSPSSAPTRFATLPIGEER